MILHLSRSDWDGDIIPQTGTASPIFLVCWQLKTEGFTEATITATRKILRHRSKHCNLAEPKTVKDFIALKECGNRFKESLAEAYDYYVRCNGLTWIKPFYKLYDKWPKIPTEQRIKMLIASANLRMALVLSMMRDLGTRPIELSWLKVRDCHLEKVTINITTAKFGVDRTLKVKSGTLGILKTYIGKHSIGLNERIFPIQSFTLCESYRKHRNFLAAILQDPSFKSIRLYNFRHYRASKEYHKTKDLLYVKQNLGHSDLSKLKYIQLVDFGEEGYICKMAKTLEETAALIGGPV